MHRFQVKLITGILYPDNILLDWVKEKLTSIWGPYERISDEYPFDKTDYYREISPVLFRRFISFKGLFDPGQIVTWKRSSCEVEELSGKSRKINIDPGYVDGARLVLASTKDHAHRIYISQGIFAEVTMRYRYGRWVPFDYTFPDFASGIYNNFFEQVRNDWLVQKCPGRQST